MFFWQFSNLISSWIHGHMAFIVIVDAGTGHTMGWSLIGKRSFFVNHLCESIAIGNKFQSEMEVWHWFHWIELRAHKMGWGSISQKIDVWQQFSAKIATCCSAERVSCSKVERSEKVRTELMSEGPSFQLAVYPLPLSTLYQKKLSPQTKEQRLQREFMSEGPSFHLMFTLCHSQCTYSILESVMSLTPHFLHVNKQRSKDYERSWCLNAITSVVVLDANREQRMQTKFIFDIPSFIWLSLTKKEQGARDYKKGWSWSPPALRGRKETRANNNFTQFSGAFLKYMTHSWLVGRYEEMQFCSFTVLHLCTQRFSNTALKFTTHLIHSRKAYIVCINLS